MSSFSFTFRAIVRVRRTEPATKHFTGLEITVRARSTVGKEWVQYEADGVGLDSIAAQLPHIDKLKLDEAAVLDCVLAAWTYKSYDHYYGGYEYDAGTDVVRSRCLKRSRRSTRRMDRLCYRPSKETTCPV